VLEIVHHHELVAVAQKELQCFDQRLGTDVAEPDRGRQRGDHHGGI
jgi:hypothetical protein